MDMYVYPIHIEYNQASEQLEFRSRDTSYEQRPSSSTLFALLEDLNNLKQSKFSCMSGYVLKKVKKKHVDALNGKYAAELSANYLLINKTPEQPRVAFACIGFEVVPKTHFGSQPMNPTIKEPELNDNSEYPIFDGSRPSLPNGF